MLMPYKVDGDYEFRIGFTRIEGSNSIVQYFRLGEGQAMFQVSTSSAGGMSAGFSGINGVSIKESTDPTTVRRGEHFKITPGKSHTMTVRVVGDTVSGTIEDEPPFHYTTKNNGKELSLEDKLWGFYKKPDFDLAFGALGSTVKYHEVKVRKLKAAGTD